MSPKQIDKAINSFGKLPYRKEPYLKKNWGHPIQSLCSYPSKLKPSIANVLIKNFSNPKDKVLDPFCGCGTVPFEACNEGRNGIGVDLSPFAHYITLAKVNIPDKKSVMYDINKLECYIKENINQVDINSQNVEDEIKEFFHEKTMKEIILSKQFLLNKQGLKREKYAIIWASIAHILHGNRPYALSRRSHNIIPIPPKGEIKYKSLIKSLTEKINRSYLKPLNRTYIKGKALNNSAFNLPFKDETIDSIITSPPFLGTTEFLRQNRIRLWYAGWNYDYQNKSKKKFLEYEKSLDSYRKLLDEMFRILKKGGLLIIHLGVVKELDMANEILPFARDSGFKEKGLIYEDVKKLENHGRTDRGGTHTHQFLFLLKPRILIPQDR